MRNRPFFSRGRSPGRGGSGLKMQPRKNYVLSPRPAPHHPQLCPSIILDTTDRELFTACRACPEGRRLVASVGGRMDETVTIKETAMTASVQPEQPQRAQAEPEQQEAPAQSKKSRVQYLPKRKRVDRAWVFDMAPVPTSIMVDEIRRRLPKSVIILFQ